MPYGPGKPVHPWSGEWQDASVSLSLSGVRVGVLEVSLGSCQVKREVMWSCPGGNMESQQKGHTWEDAGTGDTTSLSRQNSCGELGAAPALLDPAPLLMLLEATKASVNFNEK